MAILECQIISNFVLHIDQSKELNKEQSKALNKPLNSTIISAKIIQWVKQTLFVELQLFIVF